MRAVLDVVLLALQIYTWLLIISAVLSWLIAFNVVNTRNQFVSTIWDMLRPTERLVSSRMRCLNVASGFSATFNFTTFPGATQKL